MSDIYESEAEYKVADYYDACDTETLAHDFEHEALLKWCEETNVAHVSELRDKTCVVMAYSVNGRDPRTTGKRTLSGDELVEHMRGLLVLNPKEKE